MSAARTRTPTRAGAARKPLRPPDSPRRRRLHPAVIPAATLLFVLAALGATVADQFTVKRVDVVGANLPATAIVQTADVTGKNIFRLRSDSIVQRLQRLPSIEVTRVETRFPDTVTIYATLRQPYVAWRPANVTYLVDAGGTIIGRAGSTTLPLIVGTSAARTPPFAVLQAARYAVSALPTAPDGAIQQIQMDPRLGLVILGRSGWQAVVGTGDPQSLVSRLATLASLLKALYARGQHLKYADLRYREPYYRTK